MSYKFAEFELVTIKSQEELPTGAVRGWDETGLLYDVHLPGGNVLQVSEDELETTSHFETPFRLFEVVEIQPLRFEDEPEFINIVGKRGVITGVSASTQSGLWGFAVDVQSGECWYLEENELKSVGIILSEEELFGPSEDMVTVRLGYNSVTEEQTVIDGNAALLNRGPTPLRVDLSVF